MLVMDYYLFVGLEKVCKNPLIINFYTHIRNCITQTLEFGSVIFNKYYAIFNPLHIRHLSDIELSELYLIIRAKIFRPRMD